MTVTQNYKRMNKFVFLCLKLLKVNILIFSTLLILVSFISKGSNFKLTESLLLNQLSSQVFSLTFSKTGSLLK